MMRPPWQEEDKMSGFLGQIIGGLFGGGNSPLAQAVPAVLQQLMGPQGPNGGGLAGLLQQLEAAGLGQQVQSWIGTGENHPVTAEQLADALPAEHVEAIAQQANTTPANVLQLLAQMLPQAVDHATPNGEVPQGTGQVPDLAGIAARLLGGIR
jgi:uncharacterized protein YidB (DUF937 family)